MRILLVEDDNRIGSNIKTMLEKKGYSVDLVALANDAHEHILIETYDLFLFDWKLPDGSGIELCKFVRSSEITTPVLILTAKSQIEDKVEGLDAGADDYLTKPFEWEELLARVRALLRRKEHDVVSPTITISDLEINTNSMTVTRKGEAVQLTAKEFALLEYLARNVNKVLTREEIQTHVWDENADSFNNTIEVHIRYLRVKIDEGHNQKLIKTVKNKGYMLCSN
jgi:DNA-binding response OmpR family regulator